MQVTEVTDSFSLESVVPFFQPIMDLHNNVVWSYECLARLVTRDDKVYVPSEFLFLIDRQHSAAQLTETIFNRSASYFRDINMAWNININLSDMTDLGTHKFFYSQLRKYPNPNRVSIEITAQNALNELEKFTTFAKMCAGLGVKIVIDHFDKNISNVKAVLQLPISAIKISGGVFEQMAENTEHAEYVEHLVSESQANNIALIAEHIEQEKTLRLVKKLGIKYAQGFYFSQPKAET